MERPSADQRSEHFFGPGYGPVQSRSPGEDDGRPIRVPASPSFHAAASILAHRQWIPNTHLIMGCAP